MKRHLAKALTAAVLTSGCATLIGGGPAEVSVNVQEPRQDLEVRLQGIQSGETIIQRVPEFTVPLNRSSDYKVTVRSPLYQTQEILIGRSIRPIFWLNFITVVPLGMIVDAVTQNMWEHQPNRITVRLQPARQSSNGDWVLPILVTRGLSREVYEAPIIR